MWHKQINTQNIVYGATVCGNGSTSKAICPSGKIVSGGGSQLISWVSGGISPDESVPTSDGRGWSIYIGGVAANSCQRAVAVCF